MVVVGAGVIGIEYASMFAALGTRVTVVDQRPSMLDFCDEEIVESLRFHLRDLAVSFRFGEQVEKVEVSDRGTVTTPGKRQAHPRRDGHVLGRDARARPTSSTSTTAGLVRRRARPASRWTRATGPNVEHIYAVGDVIGFPALAATQHGAGPAGGAARDGRAGARA